MVPVRAPDNLHKWIAKLMKRFSASSPEQKAAALCELTQKENSPDLHPNMLHLLRRLVGSPFGKYPKDPNFRIKPGI